jgi:23S rRNA (cytidine1920-2'-O)/16S rRNA (cytidine1409-2'-O)-methyltransferase
VGHGGVVRDPDARRDALVAVAEAARGLDACVLGFASSGLPGPKGNRETFVRLAEAGRATGLDGRSALVAAAEAVREP